MRIHSFGYVLFILLIITASTPLLLSFIPSLSETKVLALPVDTRKEEADRLLEKGITEIAQNGQITKSLKYLQEALSIYREIKNREGEWKALRYLAFRASYLGDYPKAINYEEQRLKIAREIQDRNGEFEALANLIQNYQNLENYPKAIEYAQQNLKIARETQLRDYEASALGTLAVSYLFLRDYHKVIEYGQQYLKITREMQYRPGALPLLYYLAGSAYSFLGDYAGGIDYYQQILKIAREIKDVREEVAILNNIGEIYRNLEDYAKAIDYQQQSLKIAISTKDRQQEGRGLSSLGYTFYKQGNFNLAESTLLKAINVYESLRSNQKFTDKEKVLISEGQNRTYVILQQVLISQNKNQSALEIAESGRSRMFVELLANKISPNSQQLLVPTKIKQILKTAKTQNATLVEYSLIYDEFKFRDQREIKELELYIWVIKPTGEITFRKADLKPLWQKDNITLDSLVGKSRLSIGARGHNDRRGIDVTYDPNGTKNSTESNKELRQLYNLLISPIADLLPKNENDRVIFIPQSSLFFVPFPALQDDNGKYLIEKHTILTAPAIQVLDLTHKQKQKVTGKGALVVGNPTISPLLSKEYNLSPLNGAEQEAIEIAEILKTKPILAKVATKSRVLQSMQQAKIIHLATHGLLDVTYSLLDNVRKLDTPGAVVLAPSDGDNGLLTASEILDLKLGADLVVLSACDTGQGKLFTAEGIIGLSRSLIIAGTPSVIVTLWKIPDAPTKVLMTDFYQNLQQNPDKAVALRKAMLKTMKKYPNPVNWGAFTLVGEAQ